MKDQDMLYFQGQAAHRAFLYLRAADHRGRRAQEPLLVTTANMAASKLASLVGEAPFDVTTERGAYRISQMGGRPVLTFEPKGRIRSLSMLTLSVTGDGFRDIVPEDNPAILLDFIEDLPTLVDSFGAIADHQLTGMQM